jgi:cysteine desulfurase/selenocysteine lyase
VPISGRGELRIEALDELLTPRTRIVALAHVSNALGTANPVKAVVDAAHRRGIPVLVDGAQAAPHVALDVQDLGCDFYTFSGHKVYGPMGIGVLYGRLDLLEWMPPWQFGGDMVETVNFGRTTFGGPPHRFEAGTPNVAGAVGLAAALDFLGGIGPAAVADHEARLLELAVRQLGEIPGVRLIGEPVHRAGVVSFTVDGASLSALDVAARLDAAGIAVRSGDHCCQPLMRRLGVAGTIRASFAVYNDADDVERLASAVRAIAARTGAGSGARRGDDSEPAYPGPTARTIDEAAASILEDLDGLDDWSERYEYLIGLGRKTVPLPGTLRTEANRVRGCQSTVYLAARVRPGSRDVVEFLADSDGELVRGLLALLQHLFSGRRAGDLLAFDLPRFLAQAGLVSNLTAGRRNGLAEMIKRLRGFAASVGSGGSDVTMAGPGDGYHADGRKPCPLPASPPPREVEAAVPGGRPGRRREDVPTLPNATR